MARVADRIDYRMGRYLRALIEVYGMSKSAAVLASGREQVMRAAALDRATHGFAVGLYRSAAEHLLGLGLVAQGATTEELHVAALGWADRVLAEREGRA